MKPDRQPEEMAEGGLYHIRVCAAIRRPGDEILIVRESYHGRERSVFPGGAPEYGETLKEAVVREVREETGYEILPTEVAYVKEYRIQRWAEATLEICFYAELVSATPGGARHGEYIRSIDWRRIADPELQREMPQVAVFASSRKGQYYEQARSSAGG
ncbi:MAG: NUDIX hydrolase [Vulcanimicrobiaceae bacterium]